MIRKSILNTKGVAVWVLFSVFIGVYAFYATSKQSNKIEKGKSAVICNDSTQLVIPAIRKVIDNNDPDNYLKFSRGELKTMEFFGRILPKGISVTIIDTMDTHPEIYEIYIYRENPTAQNPRQEYLWIWKGFICGENNVSII